MSGSIACFPSVTSQSRGLSQTNPVGLFPFPKFAYSSSLPPSLPPLPPSPRFLQAYYKEQFAGFSKYYYWKYIRPGSVKPLAHLMVLTGVVGYTVEWFALGQHHVAHKKAIVDKALAEHGHGH